jgi:hypothetical protein
VQRLDDLAAEQRDYTKTVSARIERFEAQLADIRERLARLEAARNADRAEMQADIARFKVEVERADLRLARLLPVPGRPRKPSPADDSAETDGSGRRPSGA